MIGASMTTIEIFFTNKSLGNDSIWEPVQGISTDPHFFFFLPRLCQFYDESDGTSMRIVKTHEQVQRLIFAPIRISRFPRDFLRAATVSFSFSFSFAM